MVQGYLTAKKGLIMGVANEKSIAWAIASKLLREDADLTFSYQGEAQKKRLVQLLKKELNLTDQEAEQKLFFCDVEDENSVYNLGRLVKEKLGHIDVFLHSLAFSNKEELKGAYLETTRKNFNQTMLISAYSLTELTQTFLNLGVFSKEASIVTVSYIGAERYVPHYNVMGVAKAALEASVRYLAADVGGLGIRVNALSSGPMKTLAGAAIGSARAIYKQSEEQAFLKHNPTAEEVGNAGFYLLSDLSSGITGETHYVDGGVSASLMSKAF